jgi:hypothetical protein
MKRMILGKAKQLKVHTLINHVGNMLSDFSS